MTIALEKDSNEIVHGSALRALDDEHIQKNDYICPDDKCLMPAIPSSYKETNIPASHFKYKEHSPECIVTLQKNSSKKSKGTSNEYYYSYIDVLKEPSERKPRCGIAKQGTSNKTESTQPNIEKGKTSRYLEAVIDYYLDETEEAANRTLKLPKHPKKTYRATFQLITDNKQYNSGHIFYSKLKFNTRLEDADGCITLALLPKNNGEQYLLKINTSKWSNQKKNAFNLACSTAFQKAKEHYIKQKKAKKYPTEHPYIFFVAQNPIIKANEFEVEHFEFVSLRYLPQLHLPFNDRGIKKVYQTIEV
ncbi:hypothetical protein V3H27_22275, partial [Vibrio parahaemolyticus]|nr:hypothetical protein [Vibrio parahaemolyticus]